MAYEDSCIAKYDFNRSGSVNVPNTAGVTAQAQEMGCAIKYDFNRTTTSDVPNTIRPTAQERNCIIKWDFNQASGATVVNSISSSYTLATATGTYAALASGAYKLTDATNSAWTATTTSTLNRITTVSYEFVIYSGTLADIPLYVKGNLGVALESDGQICIYREAAGDDDDYWTYRSAASTIAANTYYHLVVTWDMEHTNHVPKLYVNKVAKTLTQDLTGDYHWSSNTANPRVFSVGAAHAGTGQAILLFRLFNGYILSPTDAANNFLAEQWRISGLTNAGAAATAGVDCYFYRFLSGDVDTMDVGALNLSQKFTVEWVGNVASTTASDQWLVGKLSDAGNGWLLYWNNATLKFTFASFTTGFAAQYTISQTNAQAYGLITHVDVTYDPTAASNNLKLYINGILDAQVSATAATVLDATALRIGRVSNADTYLTRIYNDSVLSATDIGQNCLAEAWRYGGLTNDGADSAAGVNSYCYDIVAANTDYLTTSAAVTLRNTFTLEWICAYDNQDADYAIFGAGTVAATRWYAYIDDDAATGKGRVVFKANNGIFSITSTSELTYGQVYHVILTYDSAGSPGDDQIKLYIDGVLDTQGPLCSYLAPYIINANAVLYLGWDAVAAGYFDGQIYLFRIYNATLSPAEVSQAYTSELWRTTITKTSEYVETIPATYKVWARNWDYTLRNPISTWLTLDMSLKYCDISTVVMTMNTEDFLAGWFDTTYTPITEGTWIVNRVAKVGDTTPYVYPDRRYFKGTGIVIWRNQDVSPIFNGMITDFKSHRVVKGEDTCEITFSSDEQLLLEHIAFPDILPGSNQASGQLMPDSNGIWGSASGHAKWGHQWGAYGDQAGDEYSELTDSQEAQMKGFVQDQIGPRAASHTTTNRLINVLAVEAMWNSGDGGVTGGYGYSVALTDILETLLDLCKLCVVPQPTDTAVAYTPAMEVQFYIKYLYPPEQMVSVLVNAANKNSAGYPAVKHSGTGFGSAATNQFRVGDVVTLTSDVPHTETHTITAIVSSTEFTVNANLTYAYPSANASTVSTPAYHLKFCTKTATNAAQRVTTTTMSSRGETDTDGAGGQTDVNMGEHDKRTTCVFSEKTGTVAEVDYEELRPAVNQLFVVGPTPADDTNVTTTALASTQGHSQHWYGTPETAWNDEPDYADMGAADAQAAETQKNVSTIDHRMYKRVAGAPITASQDIYGVIEGSFDHSTSEGDSQSKTLNWMQQTGRGELNTKLTNKYIEAKVTESTLLKLSPDEGLQNFWIGDYVSVVTAYGTIENLVREVNIAIDTNGEVVKVTVGTPATAYYNWWTATEKSKRHTRHHRRTCNSHYHRSQGW